jgi:hypothetical protein
MVSDCFYHVDMWLYSYILTSTCKCDAGLPQRLITNRVIIQTVL